MVRQKRKALNIFCDRRTQSAVSAIEKRILSGESGKLGWSQNVDLEQIAQVLRKAVDNKVVLPIKAAEYFAASLQKRQDMLTEWRSETPLYFETPTVLTDKNGVCLLWYLPDLFGNALKNDVFRSTKLIENKLVNAVKLSDHSWEEDEFSRTQRGWRNDENLFIDRRARQMVFVGLRNFSFGWRGSGHEWTDDPVKASYSLRLPKRDVLNTQTWLKRISKMQLTMSLVLSFIHPELYTAGKKVLDYCCDPVRSPDTCRWAEIWNSIFTALCVISGRRAVPHVDTHGSTRYLDGLVSLGTARDAKMVFRELNTEFAYGPGSALFFSGKGWTHEVPAWTQGERVCYANYMRPEMLAEHGIIVQGYGRVLQ
ncbi:hypothetical protein VKT23_014021 [Stygiomarasmius scandens]|uniref:Uncharacterized protein n=1 Tax=Marasmiellus scandens TaxID=2682957 RepID=A0ABR1J4L1_9AGAR